MLRESEDSSGEMTIEQYLYRTDPFRSTTATIPFPLPLEKKGPLLSDDDFQRLRPHIQETLDSYNIKDQYIAQFYELSKMNYPRGSIRVPTLLIEFYEGKGPSSSWSAARDALRRLLNRTGYTSVEVEIVDESRAFLPSIFPQAASTGPIQLYEDIRDQLVTLLFTRLGGAWNCMSLFRVGRTNDVAVPTIVIYVDPFASCDWHELERAVQAEMEPKMPARRVIGVEFLPGKVSDCVGKALDEGPLVPPNMGASIGIRGGEGSGTMGGYINLQIGDQTHFGLLTNHHVIAPPSTAAEGAQTEAAKGYRYSSQLATRPVIEYPSHEDLRATREDLEKRVDDFSKMAAQLEGQQEERALVGARAMPKLETNRRTFLETADAMKRELNRHKDLPMSLGRVLVTSGKAINSKRAIIDWAFIELAKPNQGPFNLPFPRLNQLPPGTHPQLMSMHYRGAAEYPGSFGESKPLYATDFGEIHKGEWYFKTGRTSKTTAGLCNGTETEINRTNQGTRFDELGNPYILGSKSTRELVILSYKKGSTQTAFSEPGDSGSFIINKFGDVCGLLYGEHTGLCGAREDCGAGLVTSMDDICASVASKTTLQDGKGNIISGELTLSSPPGPGTRD